MGPDGRTGKPERPAGSCVCRFQVPSGGTSVSPSVPAVVGLEDGWAGVLRKARARGSCIRKKTGQLTSHVQGDPGLGCLDGRGSRTRGRALSRWLLHLWLSGGEASPVSLSLERRTVSLPVSCFFTDSTWPWWRACVRTVFAPVSGLATRIVGDSLVLRLIPAFSFARGESGAAGNPQWWPLSLAPVPYPAVQPCGAFLALRQCLCY